MLARVEGTQADRQGHVIVCGLPGVGLRIVEQLALSGVPAVVVDDNPAPALAELIAAWDVPLVTGPARTAETLMSALVSALAIPLKIEGHIIQTGLSIGVALYPDQGLSPDELHAAADQAMYLAKRGARGRTENVIAFPKFPV